HDSEHHFWQFGNQPVDLDKMGQKGRPVPSPIDKLMLAKWVDDPAHYIYCSLYPRQRVKLTPDHSCINKK
ncbi:MAG TPA: hypothetical protein VKU83_07220, partial [Puia sp.]|nr:hypothetical protein [Puia sp.]